MTPDRQALLALLQSHRPSDDKERSDLETLRRHAVELTHPFSRAQPGAHFTGSAVVVDLEGQRVLLLHHRKLNRWLQPGGHAEAADEGCLETTALREAAEESGLKVRLHPSAPRPLDVDLHRIPARKDEPEHHHLDVRFLVVAENPEALAHDVVESNAAQWLTFEEALLRADEAPLQRLLLKAQAALSAR